MEILLKSRCSPGASVIRTGNGWRLDIPYGRKGNYRLAQLDDYASLSRNNFLHIPPCSITLIAKVSISNFPGTWGFGFWNDPFGFSFGFGGTAGRLPIMPSSTWFFHASPPNWLSLSDKIPARGFFAGTITTPRVPALLLAPALLTAPLLAIKPISRLLRRIARKIIQQDAALITVNDTEWHEYSIQWLREYSQFIIDGETIMKTSISPIPPLGLVIWIDNQYAAWTSEGCLGYGTLDNPAAQLEIRSINKNN